MLPSENDHEQSASKVLRGFLSSRSNTYNELMDLKEKVD